MSLATNLLMILLAINLGLFVFGNPENNSPMLGILKAIFTGDVQWDYILHSIGNNLWVYGALMLMIAFAAVATGANPLTGGGGYGAILTLQVLSIAVVSSLLLMPNLSTFGFPVMIEFILNIIFGGWVTVTVISLLRGY